MEHHKLISYFILALIIAVFGLVVYQVVMQEQKVDQYYVTVSLSALSQDPTTGPPVYPVGPDGTIDGGIKQVRDSIQQVASNSPNFKIPHESKWKLNVVPVINEANGSIANVYYHYTFPVSTFLVSRSVNQSNNFSSLLGTDSTLASFFVGSEKLTWAQNFFDDNATMNLTYGTYGSGTVSQTA